MLLQRLLASCDDVLNEESHDLRIRPLPDPPSKDTQTAFLTYAFDYNPPQVPSIESLGTDIAGPTASGSPSWLRQRSARNWKGLLKVWFPLNVEGLGPLERMEPCRTPIPRSSALMSSG